LVAVPHDAPHVGDEPPLRTAWFGADLNVLVGLSWLRGGGGFSFGFGGSHGDADTLGRVVNLYLPLEIGTPASRRWPSLVLTSALGIGMMTDAGDDDATGETADDGDDRQPEGRGFGSYGLLVRVPVAALRDPETGWASVEIAVQREHSWWFNDRVAETAARTHHLFSLGVSYSFFR
jgi:hypothetical protein